MTGFKILNNLNLTFVQNFHCMIKRVVKLIFKEEEIENFENLFQERKEKIRAFEGCMHLELWQNKNNPKEFFTYSFWESEAHLNQYRHSDYFEETWTITKAMFDGKPMAWTVNGLEYLP